MRAQLQLPSYQDPDAERRARWYQEEAISAALKSLEADGKALLVMATGLGKSFILARIAKAIAKRGGSVLAMAHRDELIWQLQSELEEAGCGTVGIEKAEFRSNAYDQVVVGSVQSFNARRLARLPKDRFQLIIIDEVHHALSNQYTKVLEHFSPPNLLGVTATPDRGDKRSLARIFPAITYSLGIGEGIQHGYLTPLKGYSIFLDSIDISGVSRDAGDLAAGQLDLAMVKAVEGIVSETIRIGGERQGICFFAGRRSAELAFERFNAIRPGCAIYIDAKTPDEERKRDIARYRRGEVQYLCNVGIANEGFDAPRTSLIVHGAPTLSRAIYVQRTGRGTRVLPGTVDTIGAQGNDGDARRRQAIKCSSKPDCLVLDFVGVCGKHQLVTPVDVLSEAGGYSDQEKALAKKKALAQPGEDTASLLEQARAELRRIAQTMGSKIGSRMAEIDLFNPFNVLHIKHDHTLPTNYKPMSDAQRKALLNCGVRKEYVDKLDGGSATKLLNSMAARRMRGLATFNQVAKLKEFGVEQINISLDRARQALDYIAGTGWGKRAPVSQERLGEILGRPKA